MEQKIYNHISNLLNLKNDYVPLELVFRFEQKLRSMRIRFRRGLISGKYQCFYLA